MKGHFNNFLSVSVLAVAVATSSGAFAQSVAPGSSGGIEEIIVTAQKRQENVNDVGMSITAVTGNQLASAGIRGPEDLVKAVPGFNYTKSAYGTPVYTLRGIGFYSLVANASPAVSIYQDEIPLPYSYMSRGAGFDVQRVEVLKGPQGTLFGQNATGGAINYIANRPTDEFGIGGDLSMNNFGQVTVNGYASGPLSDTLKGRVSVNVDQGGAWQRSYTRPGDELGTSRFAAGRLLLDWDPSSRLSLKFNANGWVDRSDEQASQVVGLMVSGRTPAALVNAFNQYPAWDNARDADWSPGVPFGAGLSYARHRFDQYKRDNRFGQLALRADYDLTDDIKLTSITSWSKLRQKSFTDTDGMVVASYHASSVADIRSVSQELRLSGKLGDLQWVVGGNYGDDDIFIDGATYSQLGTFPFPTAGSLSSNRVKAYAVFGNLEYRLTDHLSILGGIRYTKVDIHHEGCTVDGGDGIFSAYIRGLAATNGVAIARPANGACVTLNPATFQPGMVISDLNEDNVPFRLGVNWKFDRSSLLYATVSRGFKAGSFTPVGAVFAPSLDPATQESVLAYEAGFKLGLADNHVQLNGAVFYYNYEDKQVQGKIVVPPLGTFNKLINIPKSRIVGAELQVTWVPSEHFRINAGGSYTKSEIRDNFTNYNAMGLLENMNGQSLPFTPKWQLVADAEYSLPVSSGQEAFIGAAARYQSDGYSGLGEEALFKINGYGNLDLRAGVRSDDDKWSFTGFVDNVTNKYSWNFVGLSGPDVVSRLANRPRTFGIRFSIKN